MAFGMHAFHHFDLVKLHDEHSEDSKKSILLDSLTDYFDGIFYVILFLLQLVIIIMSNMKAFRAPVIPVGSIGRYENFGITMNQNSGYMSYTEEAKRNLIYLHSWLFIIFWMPFFLVLMICSFSEKDEKKIIWLAGTYLFGLLKSIFATVGTFKVYPDSRNLMYAFREFILTYWD